VQVTVTAGWYQDYRDLLLMGYEGRFLWDEAFRAQDQIAELVESVGHPCALLLDFPHDALNLTNSLTNARTMMARRHPRLHKIVLVSPAPLTRALGNTFARFMGPTGQAFEVCSTLPEAERRLQDAGFMRIKAAPHD
jgi:hypothetical protein